MISEMIGEEAVEGYKARYNLHKNERVWLDFTINRLNETKWMLHTPFGEKQIDSASASALVAGRGKAEWMIW